MIKRKLGKSGLEVAPLAFGGNVFGWTADEATSFELLDAFVAAGFNLIDTANSYSRWVPGNKGGESETIIGNWLRQRPGARAKVLIATKVGSEMGPGESGLAKPYIVAEVERSLRRLSTDYIDLYQSHRDDPKTSVDETLEAYDQLIRQGKVRVIGASNFTAARLAASLRSSAARGLPRYESLQPEYNLYTRDKFEGELSELCLEEQIGIIPYFSLASGFLTGKYRSEADFGKSPRGQRMQSMLNARGRGILAALDKIGRETNATPAQVSLAWLLAHGVTAPIASATSVEQLNELTQGATLELTRDAVAALDEASAAAERSEATMVNKSLLASLLMLAAAATPVRAALAADCGKLQSTSFPDTRIMLVEEVAPNPIWIYPPSLFTTRAERLANGPVGAQKPFCRVVGIIEKEINFEVWLPRDWNGKFQGVGNGGLTGAINYPAMGEALAQGYATASTDTGHRTQQSFFEDEWLEGHPERLVNFAYRAHHLMAVTSKQIVKAYYRKPATRAYYSGCSSGGWEGLSEAQRYPQDYDGIVAGAPAINFVQVQARSIYVAQMNLKNPQGTLTHDLAQRLAAAAVEKCDARDGLKDGVIDDPRRCDFDPAELQCKSDSSKDCLTEAQVNSARTLYGPMKSPGGMQLYPGGAYGASPLAELPVSAKTEPGHAAITLMLPQKPAWDVHTFNADRDVPALQKDLAATLNAMNPDLHQFEAHGGKLIMYHGWADPLLSPYNTLDYYGAVVKAMGGQAAADKFLRLFMVPGMEHCRGGPGPDTFDAVASVDNWVEHGVAPERLIAAHKGADGKTIDRTRPLCRYPQVARYKGSGSTDEASSFRCQVL